MRAHFNLKTGQVHDEMSSMTGTHVCYDCVSQHRMPTDLYVPYNPKATPSELHHWCHLVCSYCFRKNRDCNVGVCCATGCTRERSSKTCKNEHQVTYHLCDECLQKAKKEQDETLAKVSPREPHLGSSVVDERAEKMKVALVPRPGNPFKRVLCRGIARSARLRTLEKLVTETALGAALLDVDVLSLCGVRACPPDREGALQRPIAKRWTTRRMAAIADRIKVSDTSRAESDSSSSGEDFDLGALQDAVTVAISAVM